jgi:PAS domain S-box-containing protein
MAHLKQVFWVKSADDDAVLYVSPAYETVSGRTCESLYDDFHTFLDAVHPDDVERVAGAMADQRETGGYEQEYRAVRSDGAIRQIWARSYPVRNAEGRVLRFAGIAEDVTERKALEQDRARLAAIVEYSDDAIVSMSADCIIISWNPGAERQYGYTAEEVIGCPLSVLFPVEHYQEYQRTLMSVRQGQPVTSCDTVRRRKDGTLLSTSVNIFPIEARNHELLGASKIGRDVTAIKRLEDQFIAAQRMDTVGQLAARIAHDVNNFLSVIMSCGDLMTSALRRGAPLGEHLETMQQAADSAAELAGQLLALSRRQEEVAGLVDLNEVVRSLEPMLRRLVGTNVSLAVVRGESVGRVKVETGRLSQVLLNLVVNARDAMPDGGTISVETSSVALDDGPAPSKVGTTPGRHALLSVTDTGTGMTDEVRARLFEPFFTTKPKGKGTGLGLATCETIVHQCGGRIVVRSELGRGSTFEVMLPTVPSAPD